ncbi:MAG: single-stranded DNA-binding protein [Syntrophorhabdaceae bacterium]|nr:single-stranded DNA-binding protein [Syntrophorhabdaceae bacterium]
MSNVNKVILIGRLGADPELRYTTESTPVATFRIATTETWKDKNGNKQEKTEWHTIIAWRKLAEIASGYLKKGRLVYVEGRIRTREYDAKDGTKRRVYEIEATDMKLFPTGTQSEKETPVKGADAVEMTKGDEEFPPEAEDDIPL